MTTDDIDHREKRRQRRWHLVYYLRVFDANGGTLLGHVVDITAEGAMMLSDSPIEVGIEFDLWMEIPRAGGEEHTLTFRARSLWCQRDANPDFYDTGFALVEPSAETVQTIAGLVEDLQFAGPVEASPTSLDP